MITQRTIRRISNIIGVMILIVFIILSVAVGHKNKKIKSLKADLKQSELVIDSLNKRCARLGEMEAISVHTEFNVKNVNTFGIQKVGDCQMIAESYAAYTRQFILDSLYLNNIR